MRKIKFLLPVLVLFVSSCAGIKFNQASQEQTQKIKFLTEETIDQSVQSYADHEESVKSLGFAYKAAIAFEEKRGKTNYPTISMWKQLDLWINTDFVNTWKNQGKISPVAATEVKKRADVLLDHITYLEDNKIK